MNYLRAKYDNQMIMKGALGSLKVAKSYLLNKAKWEPHSLPIRMINLNAYKTRTNVKFRQVLFMESLSVRGLYLIIEWDHRLGSSMPRDGVPLSKNSNIYEI